MSDEFIF